jgi:hypothetical protein
MKTVPRTSILWVLLTAFLSFTAFYAQSYIAAQLHHEHDHEDADGRCSVCHKIELATLFLEGLGRAAAAAIVLRVFLYAKRAMRKQTPVFCRIPSLIALKVRLNP